MNNCIGHELQTDGETLCTESPAQSTSNFRCNWLPISTQKYREESSHTDNLLLLAVYKPQFVSYSPASTPSSHITQFSLGTYGELGQGLLNRRNLWLGLCPRK